MLKPLKIAVALLVAVSSLPPPATASACGGTYFSNVSPPPSIRVYLTGSGQVVTYDFRYYVKNVLPNEWIASWSRNSLRAGAEAARDYAWYFVNNGPWQHGSLCYDVDDSQNYQVFRPNSSAASTDQAVDATWNELVRKPDTVFRAEYRATLATPEGCGAGASGTTMSQQGSQLCSQAGYSWRQILATYYYPYLSIAETFAGSWLLRNSNAPGNPDIQFSYGIAGDIPVVGDWCGTGVGNPGVFREGTWYLRCSTSPGPATYIFSYGIPGDIPVVGDWTGKGFDSVGIVRSQGGLGTATWYLRNSNTAGSADYIFAYGNPGDPFVAGDWSGLLSRPGFLIDGPGTVQGGTWYLKNGLTAGGADYIFPYGNPEDSFIVGDWAGQCHTGVGVNQAYGGSGTAYWQLRNTGTSGGPADFAFYYGNPGDTFLVGDWTGQFNVTTGCDIQTIGVGR
jgi:hypothetical protein